MSWEKLGVAGTRPGVGTGKLSGAREGTGGLGEPPRPPGPEIQSERVSGEVGGRARAAEGGREGRRGGTRDLSGEGVEAEERAETGAQGTRSWGERWGGAPSARRGDSGVHCSALTKAEVPRPRPPGGGTVREAPSPALPLLPGGLQALGSPALSLSPVWAPSLGATRRLRPHSPDREAEPGMGWWWVRSGQGVRQKREQLGEDGKAEPRKLDLTPGGRLDFVSSSVLGVGSALPEVQDPLYRPSCPSPRDLPSEELWNVRIHLGSG